MLYSHYQEEGRVQPSFGVGLRWCQLPTDFQGCEDRPWESPSCCQGQLRVSRWRVKLCTLGLCYWNPVNVWDHEGLVGLLNCIWRVKQGWWRLSPRLPRVFPSHKWIWRRTRGPEWLSPHGDSIAWLGTFRIELCSGCNKNIGCAMSGLYNEFHWFLGRWGWKYDRTQCWFLDSPLQWIAVKRFISSYMVPCSSDIPCCQKNCGEHRQLQCLLVYEAIVGDNHISSLTKYSHSEHGKKMPVLH